MAVLHVTSKDFEEKVLKADKPVLVDFWASWCGPCMMMGPEFEKASEEAEDVIFVKADTGENERFVMEYQIMNIPTLILFQNGKAVRKSIGALGKQEILQFIRG